MGEESKSRYKDLGGAPCTIEENPPCQKEMKRSKGVRKGKNGGGPSAAGKLGRKGIFLTKSSAETRQHRDNLLAKKAAGGGRTLRSKTREAAAQDAPSAEKKHRGR